MRKFLASDVLRLLFFLVATFFLAALLVPQFHNLGAFLSEMTANKSVNPIIDYLGTHARKADYARYFNRSLYLAALILLPFLLFSLSARKGKVTTRGPWSFALPSRSIAPNRGQPLVTPPHPWRQLLAGFLNGTVFLAAAGALAILLGFQEWNGSYPATYASGALATASVVAVLEEIIFQGVILGIFLRSFRPALAIGLVAVIFATLHFLRPPEGVTVAHPEQALAGFAYLELIAQRLLDQDLMIQQWLPLFLVGMLLGVTRYLTSSLWLPIGLHAGWVFSFLLFGEIAAPRPDNSEWAQRLIGDNLAQGLLPLAAIGFSGLIVWLVYREPDDIPYRPAPKLENEPPSTADPTPAS